MPRLLETSELDYIAAIIDSIPYYSRSWKEMELICEPAEIDISSFRNDDCPSKVKCLRKAFSYYQKIDRSDKRLYQLIKNAIPVAKAKTDQFYQKAVKEINEVFKAPGINMYFDITQRNGLIDLSKPPKDFSGIKTNAKLIEALRERGVPDALLKYCPEESFDGNGCHALFEATKGLYEEVRKKLNIPPGVDGCGLIDTVMLGANPALIFNSYKTEQDRKDQKALAAMFKAAFSVIRNPIAHNPSVYWNGEDDLFDYFSILSFLYRKLRQCSVASRL